MGFLQQVPFPPFAAVQERLSCTAVLVHLWGMQQENCSSPKTPYPNTPGEIPGARGLPNPVPILTFICTMEQNMEREKLLGDEQEKNKRRDGNLTRFYTLQVCKNTHEAATFHEVDNCFLLLVCLRNQRAIFCSEQERAETPSKPSRVDLAFHLSSATRRTRYHSSAAALWHSTLNVTTARTGPRSS